MVPRFVNIMFAMICPIVAMVGQITDYLDDAVARWQRRPAHMPGLTESIW